MPKFYALEGMQSPQAGWSVGTHESSHYHILATGLGKEAAQDLAARLETVLGGATENAAMRERSGGVIITGDRLISFLYDLLKAMPAGEVEQLVRDATPDIVFTNGWLAEYARDLAERLRSP